MAFFDQLSQMSTPLVPESSLTYSPFSDHFSVLIKNAESSPTSSGITLQPILSVDASVKPSNNSYNLLDLIRNGSIQNQTVFLLPPVLVININRTPANNPRNKPFYFVHFPMELDLNDIETAEPRTRDKYFRSYRNSHSHVTLNADTFPARYTLVSLILCGRKGSEEQYYAIINNPNDGKFIEYMNTKTTLLDNFNVEDNKYRASVVLLCYERVNIFATTSSHQPPMPETTQEHSIPSETPPHSTQPTLSAHMAPSALSTPSSADRHTQQTDSIRDAAQRIRMNMFWNAVKSFCNTYQALPVDSDEYAHISSSLSQGLNDELVNLALHYIGQLTDEHTPEESKQQIFMNLSHLADKQLPV